MTWARVALSAERTPSTITTSPNSATFDLMKASAGSILRRSVHQRNRRDGAG